MTSCYLGLGSNLNTPERHIHLAYLALKALPQTHIQKISSHYQSKAAGVVGQPNYCNAVVLLKTRLPARVLLSYCQAIETKHGRVRKKHWGSRTLDLDLLLYGQNTLQTPDLTLPHPRLYVRDFMLIPLLELWPEAGLPDGTPLAICLRELNNNSINKIPPV